MAEKMNRRGLFGALAGVCAAALGVAALPKRSIYEFAAAELEARTLEMVCGDGVLNVSANGAVVEIDAAGIVTMTNVDGAWLRLSDKVELWSPNGITSDSGSA
jgi:hypothetical protein